MGVNISVKRKFKINGKEYSSIEELPDGIRETVRRALASRAESGRQTDTAAMRTRIVFNGAEFDSVEAMPQDVRQLYETVLRAAEAGASSPEIDVAEIRGGVPKEGTNPGTTYPGGIPQPTAFESSFSPRTMMVTVGLGALVLLLYYLWQGR